MDSEKLRDVKNHILFEVSVEVCNRVGGIYSVLKSKAPVTSLEYSYDRYIAIGKFTQSAINFEVEQLSTEDQPILHKTLQYMKNRGISYTYGRWLIDGAPRVLLFDIGNAFHWLNEWKGDLWNTTGIPSPPDDSETNDAIAFGYIVAWFLGEFISHEYERAVVVHFHEWLAGVALPLCRKRRLDLTTIFTTHATILGRYLCADNADFYNNLQYFDVDYEAGKRGIYHRYCIERAAAHSADVFTTVSHITAYESEHLLKRKPDGVLPNGLNVVKFAAVHEFQNLHATFKQKINEFVRGHFYGHNDFDLDNTLYFFISGRYEYRNKGVDLYIESLARLNERMKASDSKMTVIAFIIMPAATHSYTVEALKGQAVMKSLQNTIEHIQKGIGQRIFEKCCRHSKDFDEKFIDTSSLLTDQDKILLKRRVFALKRSTLPPIVTHNMADNNDPILTQIRRVQLFNSDDDRVKIIFHPEFLNSNNPILPLDYDDFVRGCHLGVFPSYYEPWGYTSAEAVVMGVPSVTTNISGFGCYMENIIENPSDYGVYIVDRRMKSVDESINQLTNIMYNFTTKTRRQRINQRNRCERLSDFLDWKIMGLEYIKARQLALRRAYPNSFDTDDLIDKNIDLSLGTLIKVPHPLSAPTSPKCRNGFLSIHNLDDIQNIQCLNTSEYATNKHSDNDDE
ncbi:hypothetical protein PNEG_03440 [Pneumocystis murina B123]|uniref:Glycogen [starch] synthase n=1 Tax=Pneumocystis murina (strain B123) TaxID=1069680 RepID=M7P386_PNEMU|nr:hypothetical protein PNEG_03440 [Pneumocystis murina B123]EMR08275.1 hypothetical protein PNEG_03440 [Pneumocystis murina B123]